MIRIGTKIEYDDQVWEVTDIRKEGFYLSNQDKEVKVFSRGELNANLIRKIFKVLG